MLDGAAETVRIADLIKAVAHHRIGHLHDIRAVDAATPEVVLHHGDMEGERESADDGQQQSRGKQPRQ